MIRDRWQRGPGMFWADERTVVGGDPFRSLRLTERGARFVRQVLDGERHAESAPEAALLHRLARANLLVPPTAPPAPTDDVTLVVPARADAASVQAVLDAAPTVAAIVVDDGSVPPLGGALRHGAQLRVLRNETARGPAAARNRGAREATTGWVVFCDSDILATPGWVGSLRALADGGLAVAPRVRTAEAPGPAGRFERAVCALDMGPAAGYLSPAGRLSYVPSAALLVDRQRFLALGGFDESMQVGEDVELCWRGAAHGIRYEPAVVVRHRPRATLRDALLRRATYGVSGAQLAARHPDLMRHGSFPLAAALPWMLAVAGLPRSALTASAAHLLLAPRSLPALPPVAARRAAATGQLRSALALSRMTVRPLLPVTLAGALLSGSFRRRALLAAAVGVLGRGRPSAAGWRVADDVAYSAGAWWAAVRHRRPGLLLPRLRLGRRRAAG